MSLSQRPRLRRAIPVALVAAGVALAGCGSSSKTTADTTATPSAAPTTPTTQPAADGKTLFAEKCGACHTLAAAGTTGKTGPSLDGTKETAAAVEKQIATPTGSMPANLVTGADATAVAKYVAENSGG